MRQAAKAQIRNYKTRDVLKKIIKDILKLSKAGNKADIAQILPKAFSAIDTAVKKNIIHKNNAARKKSRLARLAATK